ncbi:MAG TPA: Na-translocating system protein MpsC family protein [Solirubrobacteraceae bacterium]
MPGSEEQLTGGALNAALANEIGRLIADFTGRGAQRSRAFVDQDVVVCVLEDGATNAERNLVSAGRADLVRLQRDALQRAMGPQLIDMVERLTHRTVRVFMSGTDESGAAAVELFLLEADS